VLLYGEWVEENVLEPAAHRQYVFTVPRLLRPILFVQTFGDLANFNPHVHILAADGAFRPGGTFVPLPAVPEGLLVEGFRRPHRAGKLAQPSRGQGLGPAGVPESRRFCELRHTQYQGCSEKIAKVHARGRPERSES
jgi:hypothetical protein